MSTDVTPEVRQSPLTHGVAEEIRVIMARRQMRQSQLARALKVTEQWLSVRLRGIQPIDVNDLDMIADVLDVEPADLIPRGRRAPTTRDPQPDPRGPRSNTRPPGYGGTTRPVRQTRPVALQRRAGS